MDVDYHLLEDEAKQQGVGNKDEGCLDNISLNLNSTRKGNDSWSDISPLVVPEISSDSSEQKDEEKRKRLNSLRRTLYLLYACVRVSDPMWNFTSIIFLFAFCRFESLLWVSSFGIVTRLAAQLFGNVAVRWTENTPRPGVFLICAKNICVLIATAMLWVLFDSQTELNNHNVAVRSDQKETEDYKYYMANLPRENGSIVILIWIHLFGALAQTFDRAFCISLKYKWIPVMSKTLTDESKTKGLDPEKDCEGTAPTSSDTESSPSLSSSSFDDLKKKEGGRMSWLQETNMALKWIDWSSKLLAPALLAFVLGMSRLFILGDQGRKYRSILYHLDPNDRFQFMLLAASVLLWTLCGMVVELACLTSIRRQVPELVLNKSSFSGTKQPLKSMQQDSVANGPVTIFSELAKQLKDYFQQPISVAGIGLAILHFNIFAMDSVMIPIVLINKRGDVFQLKTACFVVGVVFAVGLAGLSIFRSSSKRFHHVRILTQCMEGSMLQFLCLFILMAFLFSIELELVPMVIFLGATRACIWAYESNVMDLMDELVPSGVRPSVELAQESLNGLCQILSLGLISVCPDPPSFDESIVLSIAAAFLGIMIHVVGMMTIANDSVPIKAS